MKVHIEITKSGGWKPLIGIYRDHKYYADEDYKRETASIEVDDECEVRELMDLLTAYIDKVAKRKICICNPEFNDHCPVHGYSIFKRT